MQWTKHNFPRFLLVSTKSGLQSTRRVLCVLSVLVGLLVSTSRAEESSDFQDSEPLSISDLDPDTRIAVSNLAVSLAAVPANETAATVEDNVAAILALLNNVYASAVKSWKTLPYAAGTTTFWQALNRNINEFPSVLPTGQSTGSYFYEIQRALYGQSGIPSSSQAILPVLWRMESSLSNKQSSVDLSFTNSVLRYLDEINHAINPTLVGIEDDVGQSTTYLGYISSLFDSEFYEQHAYQASEEDSAIRVVDAQVASALYRMNQTLQDIGYEVEHIQFPTEIAITNFGPLIAWMRTNFLATADDEYQASHAVSEIVADAEYNKAQAESAVEEFDTSPLPTNRIPSFSGDVLNPWNPLLSEAAGLKSKIENKLPTFDETGGDTITILDGTSQIPELRQLGRWDFNVREAMQDFVNQYSGVIDWCWTVFNSLTALAAILSVWNKVHSSM